jgi:hypothetical protein
MRIPQWFYVFSLVLTCLLSSCLTQPPASTWPAAEQRLYHIYQHVMKPQQLRTYASLPTAEQRAIFARQVGAAQRLDALPANERQAVLSGHPFEGMSREALYLLWGEPYWREGPAADERWWYFGDYVTLAENGNRPSDRNTVMEVLIENGKVKWWQERLPSEKRRFPFGYGFPHHPDN